MQFLQPQTRPSVLHLFVCSAAQVNYSGHRRDKLIILAIFGSELTSLF